MFSVQLVAPTLQCPNKIKKGSSKTHALQPQAQTTRWQRPFMKSLFKHSYSISDYIQNKTKFSQRAVIYLLAACWFLCEEVMSLQNQTD